MGDGASLGPNCAGSTAVAAHTPATATSTPVILDCNALLDLKDTLRGTATLNWSKDLAMRSWDGISVGNSIEEGCNPPGGGDRVTSISLDNRHNPDARLNGQVPAGFADVTAMRHINLRVNDLTGGIPAALGGMPCLRSLTLNGNDLTGPIPTALGSLPNLGGTLDLSENGLSGAIPKELGNLTDLQGLNLGDNALTGAIPKELGDMATLSWATSPTCEGCGWKAPPGALQTTTAG